MHTGGSSGAETIRVNVEVLEYHIQGNQRQLLLCRTYATIAYVRDNAVCRMPYEICRTGVRILSINSIWELGMSDHIFTALYAYKYDQCRV